MNLDLIKNYLENYLEDVIVPNINKEHKFGDTPITMNLNVLRKGSILKRMEKDIEDFLKVFSINNRVKIHWNKRPAF